MKNLSFVLVALLAFGCASKSKDSKPESNTEPVAEASQQSVESTTLPAPTPTPPPAPTVPPASLDQVLKTNERPIRACYTTQLVKSPGMKGQVEVTWNVNDKGVVTDARIKSSELSNGVVENCLVRLVKKWKFAVKFEPGTSAEVTHAFQFDVKR